MSARSPGPCPRRLALALVLTVLGALTEGIGLLVLIPLLHLIGVDVQQGACGPRRPLGGRLHSAGSVSRLNLISVLVALRRLIAGDACAPPVADGDVLLAPGGVTAYLRKRLHRVVTRASWVQLTRCRASDLTHAMTARSSASATGPTHLLGMVRDGMLRIRLPGGHALCVPARDGARGPGWPRAHAAARTRRRGRPPASARR